MTNNIRISRTGTIIPEYEYNEIEELEELINDLFSYNDQLTTRQKLIQVKSEIDFLRGKLEVLEGKK